MPKPCTWVVKLGGSLIHDASFARWLETCAVPRGARCVVVVGGGPAADEVRALHARWRFDEGLAHALAIDAMRLNARVAHALAPALTPFARTLPEGLGGVLWWPPGDCGWLGVPASWAVTSDSLAVALADVLGVDAVYLVKSRADLAAVDADVDACAADGLVDAYLPRLLRRARVPVFALSRGSLGRFERARAGAQNCGMRLLARAAGQDA